MLPERAPSEGPRSTGAVRQSFAASLQEWWKGICRRARFSTESSIERFRFSAVGAATAHAHPMMSFFCESPTGGMGKSDLCMNLFHA